MRAADAALAVVPPDGARPLLQLGDLVNETDALDERLALPAAAARGQGALGRLQAARSFSPLFALESTRERQRVLPKRGLLQCCRDDPN